MSNINVDQLSDDEKKRLLETPDTQLTKEDLALAKALKHEEYQQFQQQLLNYYPIPEDDPEVIKTYADRLKVMRKRKQLTQKELGSRVNSTKQTISKIELAERATLNISLLRQLANELDCTPDYLIGKTKNPNEYSYVDSEGTPFVKPVISFGLPKNIKFDFENIVQNSELAKRVIDCEKKLTIDELDLLCKIVDVFLHNKSEKIFFKEFFTRLGL